VTTEYRVVQCRAWMNDTGFGFTYTDLHLAGPDRATVIAAGIDDLEHDDFLIATLVDGRLAAAGHDMGDFTPEDADLPEIARQLCLDLAPTADPEGHCT
jgi:hypothetical protein